MGRFIAVTLHAPLEEESGVSVRITSGMLLMTHRLLRLDAQR